MLDREVVYFCLLRFRVRDSMVVTYNNTVSILVHVFVNYLNSCISMKIISYSLYCTKDFLLDTSCSKHLILLEGMNHI